jgi:1-deoxypentalenic acid 11beta-hydroxylase
MVARLDVTELMARNDLLGDRVGLDATFESEGYLYFRGIIAGPELEALRGRFIDDLMDQGLIERGSDGPVWTGRDVLLVDQERLHERLRVGDFWNSRRVLDVLEACLDEPAYIYKQQLFRLGFPTYEVYDQPAHQDGFYIDSEAFRTVWVPLVDLDADVGGLAIAPGSHRRGVREHQPDYDHKMLGRDHPVVGIPLEAIEEAWASAPFRVGDVLIFHPHMVHRSLPNRTRRRVRLSIDTRFQPVSAPRGYHALNDATQIKTDANERGMTALPWAEGYDARPDDRG